MEFVASRMIPGFDLSSQQDGSVTAGDRWTQGERFQGEIKSFVLGKSVSDVCGDVGGEVSLAFGCPTLDLGRDLARELRDQRQRPDGIMLKSEWELRMRQCRHT